MLAHGPLVELERLLRRAAREARVGRVVHEVEACAPLREERAEAGVGAGEVAGPARVERERAARDGIGVRGALEPRELEGRREVALGRGRREPDRVEGERREGGVAGGGQRVEPDRDEQPGAADGGEARKAAACHREGGAAEADAEQPLPRRGGSEDERAEGGRGGGGRGAEPHGDRGDETRRRTEACDEQEAEPAGERSTRRRVECRGAQPERRLRVSDQRAARSREGVEGAAEPERPQPREGERAVRGGELRGEQRGGLGPLQRRAERALLQERPGRRVEAPDAGLERRGAKPAGAVDEALRAVAPGAIEARLGGLGARRRRGRRPALPVRRGDLRARDGGCGTPRGENYDRRRRGRCRRLAVDRSGHEGGQRRTEQPAARARRIAQASPPPRRSPVSSIGGRASAL